MSRGVVFVVDDIADNRDLYELALRNAGFTVVTAAHAEEGLAKAFASPPLLVVMDHMLPGLDGCEAIKILKKDLRTATVLAIMVTGDSGPEVEELARKCGADDFRTKPLKPTDLLAAIDALLAGRV